MRRVTPLLTMATMLVGHALAARAAEVKSTAVVDIEITGEWGPPSGGGALLDAEKLLRQVVPKISKAAAESRNLPDVAHLEFAPGPKSGLFRATLNSYDERVPADKLLQQVAEALQTRLRTVNFVQNMKLDSEKRRMLQQEEAVDDFAARLGRAHEELAKVAEESGLSADAQLSAQRQMRMETELQGLGVELQGMHARREILEKTIADTGERVVSRADADAKRALARALKRRLAARKIALDQVAEAMRVGTGAVTRADVADAEANVAEAEAELALHEQKTIDEAGRRRIRDLMERLDDTAIEMAEIEARRDAVQALIKKMSRGAGEIEMQRLLVERLRRDYATASDELAKLQMKIRLYVEPRLRVIPVDP